MSSVLYRIGRFSASRPWVLIAAWVVIAIVVVVGASTVGGELEDSFEVPGLDSQVAIDLLSEAQSDQAGLTARLVATPAEEGSTFFDSVAARDHLAVVQERIEALPTVLGTSDPVGALAAGPEVATASGAISADGRIVLMTIQYPVLEELDANDLGELKEAVATAGAEASPLRIELGGDLFMNFEDPGGGSAEMIGLLAAIVILLLAFGSIIAAGLPIGIALFGLGVGIASMSLIDHVVDIPSWAPDMATMIGLGVGIDYALLLVTRHREFLADGLTVADAAGRAVATAGQAVIFAGGTVVIAILGLAVAGVPFMTAAGIATSVIVAIMVIASVTLLPAFLGLSGHWINRLGIHRRHGIGGGVGSGWQRWGRHVTGHAWPYAIGVTLLLLALSAPVLALRLGFPDEGTLPESRTERIAYDMVADGFGPGLNGPLVIAVDLADVGDAAIVASLSEAVAADVGIAAVAPADVDQTAGIATIVAFPTTSPQDDATFATVQRLRHEVFPDALDGTTVTAHVGGQTASFGDVADRVSERLPWFIAAVVMLSVLLLMVVFRSVLVPIKAALLNLLSIGAAYGVLVMVFQWGWGKELIGLESTVPIVSFIPMFMFAVLFGLSMDYEVFLLSRVREEYIATGDNDASVISGIASTARVIASAALIMICVFGGFVLGDDPVIKMMGLGLAVAIFVDATIVRIVLVPATMKLMGDANWWLPAWLDRIMPTVDIEGEAGLPAREMEVRGPMRPDADTDSENDAGADSDDRVLVST
ncbi:MAG TPA: MMPL family transporter [Ilumatobacteraceae bacterium]|nr:MMPL family transporter [Ilumatobacteraceae bacterium]